jgi:endonuclease G
MKQIKKIKMKNLLLTLSLILLWGCTAEAQNIETPQLRSEVIIENNVFKVWYSEVKEQPTKLIYTSTNRVKNVDRGSMNFYTEKDVHTSDNGDYYRNVWDKGHLAPAATYSDSYENLRQTFSYLNCALQNQYLNRGEWRLLEEKERDWDDIQNLTITVELVWDEGYEILASGGHVPTDMIKHIYFEEDGEWKCFEFENEKPTKGWEEHQVQHQH